MWFRALPAVTPVAFRTCVCRGTGAAGGAVRCGRRLATAAWDSAVGSAVGESTAIFRSVRAAPEGTARQRMARRAARRAPAGGSQRLPLRAGLPPAASGVIGGWNADGGSAAGTP